MYNDLERILFSKEQIATRVKELGAQLSKDYAGKNPIFICILKGSVLFFSDLIKEITVPINLDFMAVSSYGASTKSSGVVRILKDLDHGIEGKDVLLVEDIVDSGMSMSYLIKQLYTRKPASIKLMTLLDKPERRRVDLTADYIGFTIPDEFVIGYGLDYAEKYRNLPDVCILSPNVYADK